MLKYCTEKKRTNEGKTCSACDTFKKWQSFNKCARYPDKHAYNCRRCAAKLLNWNRKGIKVSTICKLLLFFFGAETSVNIGKCKKS